MSDDFHERIRAIDIETTAAVKRAEERERRAEQLERERQKRLNQNTQAKEMNDE